MLLDTNIMIWLVREPDVIPSRIMSRLRDPDEQRSLSIVSFWEMSIKHRKGKLPLPAPFATDPTLALEHWCARAVIDVVPLEPRHIACAMSLAFLHDDPFDRLIAATAIIEDQELVSSDARFSLCPGLRLLKV